MILATIRWRWTGKHHSKPHLRNVISVEVGGSSPIYVSWVAGSYSISLLLSYLHHHPVPNATERTNKDTSKCTVWVNVESNLVNTHLRPWLWMVDAVGGQRGKDCKETSPFDTALGVWMSLFLSALHQPSEVRKSGKIPFGKVPCKQWNWIVIEFNICSWLHGRR